jgi:hypothetical protein
MVKGNKNEFKGVNKYEKERFGRDEYKVLLNSKGIYSTAL